MRTHSSLHARIRLLAYTAMIAALYAALSFFSIPVNFFQIRPVEALAVLPCLTIAGIPGLTLGCLLANYLTGCALPDVIFGSLATFLGALGTYLLRKHPILCLVPPVISNTVIIPPMLIWVYQVEKAYPILVMSTFWGEALCCGLLGYLLSHALRHRFPVPDSRRQPKR